MRNTHKRFCREYVIDNNGTKAAIRTGYSARSADTQASRLLARPEIQAEVAKLQAAMCKRAEVTEDFIVQTLLTVIAKGLGHEDSSVIVKDGYGGGMTQTESKKMRKEDLSAVKGAADLLGRYKAMFTDNQKLEHSGKILKRIVNVNPTKKG